MNNSVKMRFVVDSLMFLTLLLSLVSGIVSDGIWKEIHVWISFIFVFFVIIHHIINFNWIKLFFKKNGK